jgi:endoglucanase
MKNIAVLATLILIFIFGSCLQVTQAQSNIRINQIGFYPKSEKIAVVVTEATSTFEIIDTETDVVVLSGTTSTPKVWTFSGESVAQADFSSLEVPGRYKLRVNNEDSYPFVVSIRVYAELSKATIKAFYFNRVSTELLADHAGKWARPAGHPDTNVRVHSSAASAARPSGTVISSPKGWYDAGDFNKYIVNSGISTYTLIAAFEHFPDFYRNLSLNIPESGNDIPDLLDEIRWNLDWMLTMQDPNDGGVYHKLTTLNFTGIIMPQQGTAQRFVVTKSTSAALNFAAVMSAAARVYSDFDPDFAQQCLDAAVYAWEWARLNRNVYFRNPTGVNTGEYGDGNVSDEFDWAAAELYITTKNDEYLNFRSFRNKGVGVPAWPYVLPLAWVSLNHHRNDLTESADKAVIESKIADQGFILRAHYLNSAYRVSKGQSNGDFGWGSNGGVANHGLMLIQAYRVTGEDSYLNAAMAVLDYLLGRNATGYSFVTGFGSKSPMFPHHRVSAADNIADPVPGFVVGGPHSGQQDGCAYPSNLPAKSYIDDWCSYATNEVAINWNAPLVYLVGAIESIIAEKTNTSSVQPEEIPSQIELEQNYPNPFNPSTKISYSLSDPAQTKITIHDLVGKEISVLVDKFMTAGNHQVTFNATGLASGIYVYRLATDEHTITKKMLVLK